MDIWRVVVQHISKLPNKPVLHPFTSPGCFAKEREARLHRWIELKTTDGNTAPQFTPPMLLDKLIENVLQRDAVQRITRMVCGCGHKI